MPAHTSPQPAATASSHLAHITHLRKKKQEQRKENTVTLRCRVHHSLTLPVGTAPQSVQRRGVPLMTRGCLDCTLMRAAMVPVLRGLLSHHSVSDSFPSGVRQHSSCVSL